MFQPNVAEEIKTHVSCLIIFFSENCAVCEIMWKSIVQPGRPQITIWSMLIAYCLRLGTLAVCNTYCFSPVTMVKKARLTVTLYLDCLTCLGVISHLWDVLKNVLKNVLNNVFK